MNQTIERLKRNKPLMVLGVIVNIIIAVYISQYIVGHYLIAHGQEDNQQNEIEINQMLDALSHGKYIQWQTIIDYCYQHSDSPNPVQNLVDKGLLSSEYNGATCKTVELKQQIVYSMVALQKKQQGFESMINYCFQHADRPNPLQDLVDKGFLSSNMTGITCLKVKQMSDINQNQISDLENKINEINK